MPPQINRLVLLTVGIVTLYFAARSVLVPKSFGQYGWYRGNALREIAASPTGYAGKAACVECHQEVLETMAKSKHQAISCESCHGPNAQHADEPTVAPAPITDPQFCLRCHRANPSRPVKFPQVDPADHFGDSKCSECHIPHSPTEEKK